MFVCLFNFLSKLNLLTPTLKQIVYIFSDGNFNKRPGKMYKVHMPVKNIKYILLLLLAISTVDKIELPSLHMVRFACWTHCILLPHRHKTLIKWIVMKIHIDIHIDLLNLCHISHKKLMLNSADEISNGMRGDFSLINAQPGKCYFSSSPIWCKVREL